MTSTADALTAVVVDFRQVLVEAEVVGEIAQEGAVVVLAVGIVVVEVEIAFFVLEDTVAALAELVSVEEVVAVEGDVEIAEIEWEELAGGPYLDSPGDCILVDSACRQNHFVLVVVELRGDVVGAPDSSSFFGHCFLTTAVIQLVVVGYHVEDGRACHLQLAEMLKVPVSSYIETRIEDQDEGVPYEGFEVEGPLAVVTYLHHRHRQGLSFQQSRRVLYVRAVGHTVDMQINGR